MGISRKSSEKSEYQRLHQEMKALTLRLIWALEKTEFGGGNITQGHNQGLMLIETETKQTCEKEGGGLASRGDILHTQSGGRRQQKHSCIIKHCLPRKHLHLRTIHPGRCLSNESCKSTEHRQAALWSQNTVIRKSHKMGFRKSLWGVLS